mmetsp:Transcript_85973/g.248178  ORF Transcript_85973/g.248178 Transcript_85973/m.248178 type:complete len:134 (-) Transcript_85973:276-677(-)
MLNRGPAKWREWRWGQLVLPLYLPDPKAPPPDESVKPLSEVAYMTIAAMRSHGQADALKEAVEKLAKEPDSPGGRVNEDRFRTTLKEAAKAVLPPEEMENIWPTPEAPSGKTSRKPSKQSRKPSKEKPAEPEN